MKAIELVLGIGLLIALPSCAPREAAPPKAPEQNAAASDGGEQQQAEAVARYAATLAEQDRVNRYFHRNVLPKLKDCWAGLESEGTIAVGVTYRRSDALWVRGESGIHRSTLARKDQEEKALRCLDAAVRDTSFPAEEGDKDAEEFLVNWTLPVPWPTDMKQVAMRMAIDNGGGGNGGCGGPETPPGCKQCWIVSLFKFSLCIPACSGYIDCVEEADGNGCRMKTKCISAPIFGNAGGFVLY